MASPKNSEFQVVLLAGGRGNRLFPLTESIPKPLLPVANRPLISFQLEMLERAGFAEAIVVTCQSIQEELSKYLTELYKGQLQVRIEVIDDFMGTADALRHVAPLLRTDFIVISGDLITDVYIHYLADIHRSRDASVTVMLQHSVASERTLGTPSTDAAPAAESGAGGGGGGGGGKKGGKKGKKKSRKSSRRGSGSGGGAESRSEHITEQQFIGIEEDAVAPRLVLFRSAVDVDDAVMVRKSVMQRHPNLAIYSNLRDCHLYIFSHWVVQLLEQKPAITSLQGELIPFLVRLQYGAPELQQPWLEVIEKQEHQQHSALRMSHAKMEDDEVLGIRCYAYLAPASSYCIRVNTVEKFALVNHDLADGRESDKWTSISETNHVGDVLNAAGSGQSATRFGATGVVVGEDVRAGDGGSVKRSVVGNHCRIGAQVKISNSIIMDHVIIEDKCQIVNSIVCRHAAIRTKARVVDSQVPASFEVESKADIKGETVGSTI